MPRHDLIAVINRRDMLRRDFKTGDVINRCDMLRHNFEAGDYGDTGCRL